MLCYHALLSVQLLKSVVPGTGVCCICSVAHERNPTFGTSLRYPRVVTNYDCFLVVSIVSKKKSLLFNTWW